MQAAPFAIGAGLAQEQMRLRNELRLGSGPDKTGLLSDVAQFQSTYV